MPRTMQESSYEVIRQNPGGDPKEVNSESLKVQECPTRITTERVEYCKFNGGVRIETKARKRDGGGTKGTRKANAR